MDEDDFGPPAWDDAFAERLVGASVIIGLTRILPDGARLEQFFGVISQATREQGIAIELDGSRAGETYWLPPDQRGFEPAPAGEYRLRSTGEVVIDPDFLSTWTIEGPPPAANDSE